MLVLRNSPASPFGRKVRIAALHLGLADRIRIDPADTNDTADPLRSQNPLGKIPVLLLESGEALYDSRVIVEFLDHLAGGGQLLPSGEARFPVLRLQALADGIMDAALVQVYEHRVRPPETVHQPWLDHQAGKVARALTALESAPPAVEVNAGTIALACALGYLDLRFEGSWRAACPGLVGWLDGFAAAAPSFAETAA